MEVAGAAEDVACDADASLERLRSLAQVGARCTGGRGLIRRRQMHAQGSRRGCQSSTARQAMVQAKPRPKARYYSIQRKDSQHETASARQPSAPARPAAPPAQALDGRLQQRRAAAGALEALKASRPAPPRHALCDDDFLVPSSSSAAASTAAKGNPRRSERAFDAADAAAERPRGDEGWSARGGAGGAAWCGDAAPAPLGVGSWSDADEAAAAAELQDQLQDAGWSAESAGADVGASDARPQRRTPPPAGGPPPPPPRSRARGGRGRSRSSSPQRRSLLADGLAAVADAAAAAPADQAGALLSALQRRLPFQATEPLVAGGAVHVPSAAAGAAAELERALWPAAAREGGPPPPLTSGPGIQGGGGSPAASLAPASAGASGHDARARAAAALAQPRVSTRGLARSGGAGSPLSGGGIASGGGGAFGMLAGVRASKSELWAQGDAAADAEADACVAALRREQQLPRAALALQCAWRARAPRLRLARCAGAAWVWRLLGARCRSLRQPHRCRARVADPRK